MKVSSVCEFPTLKIDFFAYLDLKVAIYTICHWTQTDKATNNKSYSFIIAKEHM